MTDKVTKKDIKANKKESLKAQLLQISSNVTTTDVYRLALNVDVSTRTIERYLAGNVGNVPTAERILKEVKRLAA